MESFLRVAYAGTDSVWTRVPSECARCWIVREHRTVSNVLLRCGVGAQWNAGDFEQSVKRLCGAIDETRVVSAACVCAQFHSLRVSSV
jgi:hypothetical protein